MKKKKKKQSEKEKKLTCADNLMVTVFYGMAVNGFWKRNRMSQPNFLLSFLQKGHYIFTKPQKDPSILCFHKPHPLIDSQTVEKSNCFLLTLHFFCF